MSYYSLIKRIVYSWIQKIVKLILNITTTKKKKKKKRKGNENSSNDFSFLFKSIFIFRY